LNVAVVLLGQCRPTDAWAQLLAFSHWAAKFQGWAMSMFFPLRLMVKMVLSFDLQLGAFVFALVMVLSSVLKPGPARRVDPGPGRPGPGTGPGLSKNPRGSWPGETRSTRVNPAETQLPSFFCFL